MISPIEVVLSTQELLNRNNVSEIEEGRTFAHFCAAYPPSKDVSGHYSAPVPLEVPGQPGDSFFARRRFHSGKSRFFEIV
jgi:hypothetical protein